VKSKVFWNLWSSYASYYFGRVNLSIVIPVLLATYGDLSLYNIGLVASGFMATYALGQFLHGQFSEKFNPFTYIVIGLVGSALMNLILGFSAGFFWMLLICEMFDGGFQSMGWSSTVRANAYTSKNIERDSVILGTSYQAGNSIAWIACSFTVGQFGWQWGFWLATIVMIARAATLYISRPEFKYQTKRLKERVKLTVTLPIFISGISLCLLNMIRYGVIIWVPTYLYREFSMPIEEVGLNIFLIPVAGIAGTLIYNRIKLPKDIITMLYVSALGLVVLVLPHTEGLSMFLLLLLSGLFLYGPHVFLVATMPSRFHSKNIVAAATGFIDGWGYVGSVLIGVLIPFILNITDNWHSVFYFWSILSFIIVVLVAAVYFRKGGRRQKYG